MSVTNSVSLLWESDKTKLFWRLDLNPTETRWCELKKRAVQICKSKNINEFEMFCMVEGLWSLYKRLQSFYMLQEETPVEASLSYCRDAHKSEASVLSENITLLK